jgi:fucose permease
MKSLTKEEARFYLTSGILMLLLGSFLDNIRGPLLPVLTKQFGIDYGSGSWLFVAGNIVSVAVTFLLMPVMRHISERRASLLAVGFAISACLFANFVEGFSTFIGFALLLGMTTGAVGAMCNIMTMLGSSTGSERRDLSILHMTFGLGALTAPLLLVWVQANGTGWAGSFQALLLPLVAIFILIAWKLPERGPLAPTSSGSLLLDWEQLLPLLVFGFYVAGEVMTSAWMVTYLVESEKFPFASAAVHMSLFFGAMVASRLFNLLIPNRRVENFVIFASLIIPILVHLCARYLAMPALLPLAGAVGCFFPLFLGRLKERYSQQWREMTVWTVVFLQLFVGIGHYLTGRISEVWDIRAGYGLPLGSFVMSVVLLTIFWLRSDGFAARVAVDR